MAENEQGSYTLVELSKLTKQSTDILRAFINAGKIEATKVRRGYRITAEEANRFIEELKSGEYVGFTDVTIPKVIEYSSIDGTVDTIFGIKTGDIFTFLMRCLETVREYNAGDTGNMNVTIDDVKLLTHIIKEGKIELLPREKRVVIHDSDPVTSLLIRSMATGISCSFEELSKTQNFAVEHDKIKAATEFIIKSLD